MPSGKATSHWAQQENGHKQQNAARQISVWIVGIIYSFNKYLLSVSYMPGTANVNKGKQGTVVALNELIDR